MKTMKMISKYDNDVLFACDYWPIERVLFPCHPSHTNRNALKIYIISNLMGDIYWIWILRYWLKYVRYCFFVLWFLGLDSEGIYRVSGFSDDIEALKDSFDNGIFKETLLVYATVQLETIGWLVHSKTMCSTVFFVFAFASSSMGLL